MVVNKTYRGDREFGNRIDQRRPWTERRGHEVITARIAALVTADEWQAAQDGLARNRICAKNTRRVYAAQGRHPVCDVRAQVHGLPWSRRRGLVSL